MITAGRHKARAVEAALGYTKGGKEQVAVLFEILEGDAAGQQITWHGYFTEKTEQRTLESLQHCGWTGADISNLEGIDKNEVSLVVELERSDEDGKEYPKVRWVNGAGGLAMKSRMDDVQKRQFAERMKGKVLAMRAGQPAAKTNKPTNGTKPAGGKVETGTHYDNDDFPDF